MSHEWPVNNTIVDLPIRLKRNSKCICGNKFVESAGDSEQGYGHVILHVQATYAKDNQITDQ